MSPRQDDEHHPGLLPAVLRRLTACIAARPRAVLLTVCVAVGLCLGITFVGIEFKTKRSDLINPNAAFHQRWLNYAETFGDQSDLVVVVEAARPDVIKQVLDRLGGQLESDPKHFSNVLYKIEPGLLRSKGLQYLPPQQLEIGLNNLEGYSSVLAGNWSRTDLEQFLPRLTNAIANRDPATPLAEADPLIRQADRLCTSMHGWLIDRGNFISPWPEILPVNPQMHKEAHKVTYLMNEAGTMGFLKAFPVEDERSFEGPGRSIHELRRQIDIVAEEFPEATIGLTGIPVLESDEMQRSQQDMTYASAISFFGVGLLLFVGFQGCRHPVLALTMLAVAMCWTFGYITLAIGHLNILSVSFAAILIGLGIDFAIHYLAKYIELRHQGQSLLNALIQSSSGVGAGIATAAITTSLAFFCATFTDFLGVAELGIIAGGGILLCALATFVVLPSVVTLSDRSITPEQLPSPMETRRLKSLTNRHPRFIIAASLLFIGALASQGIEVTPSGSINPRIQYDANLLNLQAEGLESVEVQDRVFDQSNGSLLYAVSLANGPADARQKRRDFEQLETVQHVEELGSYFPEIPATQTQLMVQAFNAYLTHLPETLPANHRINPAIIGHAWEELTRKLSTSDSNAHRSLHQRIESFLDGFARLELDRQIEFLLAYERRMKVALLHQFQILKSASNPEPVTLDDLPTALTSRFVSDGGDWLVQIYPKQQVWDEAPLEAFVNDVRTIDANVTGTPLQNHEAAHQIRSSYLKAALYAFAVILIVLVIDFLNFDKVLIVLLPSASVVFVVGYAMITKGAPVPDDWLALLGILMITGIALFVDPRNFVDVLFALLPPVAGGTMMLGMLSLLQVDFNPANLIVLPLVLGIGVDDGVHVVHDFRNQRRNYQTSSSTINAIILTSLTSMIGFGSMLIAAHRGLVSLGLVLVIGVASCLLVSLVPLPALLTLVSRLRTQPVEEPQQTQDSTKQEQLEARLSRLSA